MTVTSAAVGDGVSMDVSTISGTAYSAPVTVSGMTGGSWTISALDITSSAVLATTTMAQPTTATLSFTATGPSTRITATSTVATSTITLTAIPINFTTWTSGTIVTTVCSKDGDAYRYGFNTQMKVNEWAGIGNHMTAEFWEYDTRTGRRLNPDPVRKPYESSYASIGNNPIAYSDRNGDDSSKTTTDAGHGINGDHGASSKDGKNHEADYALMVENAANKYLTAFGIKNTRTRTDYLKTKKDQLDYRNDVANESGSDVFVSFHLDSDPGKKHVAIEFQAHTREGANSEFAQESQKLGLDIMAELTSFGGEPEHVTRVGTGSTAHSSLKVLNGFKGKAAVLIEFGSIGDANNRNLISTRADDIGKQIATGIYKYIYGHAPSQKGATNQGQQMQGQSNSWQKFFLPFLKQ